MAGDPGFAERAQRAAEWQVGVWDRISGTYEREIDRRFAPVVDRVIARAGVAPGHAVLDLGTGTGSVAIRAAPLVAPGGRVLAVDVSDEMLAIARRRVSAARLDHVDVRGGRAEAIPAGDAELDRVLASLSLMYAIDRDAAAREIARVLRPGGRLVVAVWGPPDRCDIVQFQQTAGRFAPEPPLPGIGPGALADPQPFVRQLAAAGVDARVESEDIRFDFDDFDAAWDALAGVTTAQLSAERQQEAKSAVRSLMWPRGGGPRRFSNLTHVIVGERTTG